MNEPVWAAVAAGVGLFVALELLLWLGHRAVPRLRRSLLHHLWALAAGATAALWLAVPDATGLLPWRLAATLALVLSGLVLFDALDSLVLSRPWDAARGPLVPKLGRDVLRILVLTGAGLFAATAVFEAKLQAVLVSSTVLSAVIGLALQDVLKNVFAGIALDLEKPFSRRDWLLLDGSGTPAQVIDISWRSTRLRTNEGVDIFEPNARLEASRLTNYGSGARPVALALEVGLPYGTPPAEAKEALLAAARGAPGVADTPPPQAFLDRFGDHAVVYRLRVWTHHVYEIARFRDETQTRIWYQLQRQGIPIPFPIRTVLLHHQDDDRERERRADRERTARLLSAIDLFRDLPPQHFDRLVESARVELYGDGETLVQEGEPGASLFVLEAGRVWVTKTGPESGTAVRLAHLTPGSFFGEMSLLTGEPRSATVTADGGARVLMLSHQALAPMLEAEPHLAEVLCSALATRQAATEATLEDRRRRQQHPRQGALEASLLERVRAFFRLGP
jgi:small-conductance mechanosensitive channel/CRP-like cAMP-binding protein